MQLMNNVVVVFFCYIVDYFLLFYNSDILDIIDPLNAKIADKGTLQFMSRERPDNVSLPSFDYQTDARDITFLIIFTIST